ncbi:general stress protein CsbD [Fodinibius sp.]|uniref:general stress protein CsbD n=1 Tax=Fodinibius sp. TaxID=1872440 RepID=UPI003569AC97
MSDLITIENWDKLKTQLIDDHPILTEKNLTYEEGKEEKLFATLQQKLGKTKTEVSTMIRGYIKQQKTE